MYSNIDIYIDTGYAFNTELQAKVMKIWDSTIHKAEQSLEIPKGRYVADFGILIEQTVNPNDVLLAAKALIKAETKVKAATQSKILVAAQESGVAFSNWAEIKTM